MAHEINVWENSRASALARLFSASVIRDLARKGSSPQFARLAKQSTVISELGSQASIQDLFEYAFEYLKKKPNRHEYVYKAAIAHKVLLGKHSLQTAVLLNEFRVGSCKADSVVLNGTSTVYEIKSERDSLARLGQQVKEYRKVFARVNVITGENHLKSVRELVPDDVGILVLSERFQISTDREAREQPERTNPHDIFDSIQLREANAILATLNVSVPRVPNTRLHQTLKEKFLKLTSEEAHSGMVRVLRKTRSLLPLSELIDALPNSVQPAALTVPLRKQDHSTLIKTMTTPIRDAIKWK